MASQAELIIAFVFNRSGKKELSFSEIYLTLSMELNWFTPDDAKEFVKKAIEHKLLEKIDGKISPLFDISKINVPIGYVPIGKLFEKNKEGNAKEPSVLDEIIDKISKETKESREEICEKIKKIEEEKNITKEIAALLVTKNYKNISDVLYKEISKRIINNF